MLSPHMVTERPLPGGGPTTLGGGTTISGGGTPDTGGGTPFWPVPAEFNHWFVVLLPATCTDLTLSETHCLAHWPVVF